MGGNDRLLQTKECEGIPTLSSAGFPIPPDLQREGQSRTCALFYSGNVMGTQLLPSRPPIALRRSRAGRLLIQSRGPSQILRLEASSVKQQACIQERARSGPT